MDALKPKFWEAPEKKTTTVYTFDTFEDTPALCTVTVIDGVVSSYSGVYALDPEIVRYLENDRVRVPPECCG